MKKQINPQKQQISLPTNNSITDFPQDKKLEQEKKNYNAVFESFQDGFITLDKSWYFTYVNKEAEKIFHQTRADLLGRSVWEIFPNANNIYTELQKSMEENIAVDFEIQGLKSGNWYRVRAYPNGNGLTIFFLVSSQHKKMEQSLRDLADIVEASNDAIISWSIEGIISHWNPAAEKIFRYTADEIIGKPISILFDPISFTIFEDKLETILAGQSTKLFESINLRKDGEQVPVSLSLFPLRDSEENIKGFSMISRDITERKRAEVALRLSEETFAKAFDASPFPMAISKVKDGQFIKVNKKFISFCGYELHEVLGKSASDLDIWETPKIRDEVLRQIKEQGRCTNAELNLRTKSHQLKNGLFSAEIIELLGEPCVLTIVNDITELKQLENEVARLDRLNLVGQMAAGIGHEIRNPMTSVRGFLQLLSSKELYRDDAEYFHLMIEELDRANLIITEYLSLAKNKVTVKERLNLNHIIKRIHPLIFSDANRYEIEVIISYNPIPDLIINEKEICQLILNLTRNGLEAMETGGKLMIRTNFAKDEVILSIKDEGSGIQPDILEKIGTPFYTTKAHGTGLGLAISYSIAHRHNAKINIETGPTGTTFYVSFPLEQESS